MCFSVTKLSKCCVILKGKIEAYYRPLIKDLMMDFGPKKGQKDNLGPWVKQSVKVKVGHIDQVR